MLCCVLLAMHLNNILQMCLILFVICGFIVSVCMVYHITLILHVSSTKWNLEEMCIVIAVATVPWKSFNP
jgi:hypothetical protein